MTQSLNDSIPSSSPSGVAGESCGGTGWLAFEARAHQFSGNFQTCEQMCVSGFVEWGIRSELGVIPSMNRAQFYLQRGATSGDGVLFDGQQHGGCVFHGPAETEPGGERDAAGLLRGKVAQIENDESEATTFQQQVGGVQGLL